MRRPPSYSDSYLYGVIPTGLPAENTTPRATLTPLLLQTSDDIQHVEAEVKQPEEIVIGQESWKEEWIRKLLILGVKGSIHITLISIFETIFFFLYVSRSENDGILKTLNTYYDPLLNICNGWTPSFRTEILDVLDWFGVANRTVVDAAGAAAAAERNSENLHLLFWSLGYTGICIGVGGICVGILVLSKRSVRWKDLLGEHIVFVLLLGLYEWFFFRTIIYNYNTLSTPELNAYLADGLFTCLSV